MKVRKIPAGYVKVTSDLTEEIGVVAYKKEVANVLLVFSGTKTKADFHYRFSTEESMIEHFNRYCASIKDKKDKKDAERKARKEFVHTLKVGDILVSSWGYEQTNITLYQVLELKGKSVVIAEIAAQETYNEMTMTGTKAPIKDKIVGAPMRKLVQEGNAVKISSYETATPANKQEYIFTSYA